MPTHYGTSFSATVRAPSTSGLNSVTVPHGTYTVGKNWDPNGTGYANGFECVGFARLIMDAWCGTIGSALGAENDLTVAKLKAYVNQLHPGSRIRFYSNSTGDAGHSVVLFHKTDSGIYLYHANYPNGTNKVAISFYTYAEMCSSYKRASGYTYNGMAYGSDWEATITY